MTSHASDELVSRADLVGLWIAAERPNGGHLIGTELEKFGVVAASAGEPLRPVGYTDHVLPVLDALVADHGWAVGPDRGNEGQVVELVRDGASITLEPGGQLELSGKPLTDVHQTCAEFTQHYRELHAVSEPLGLAWLTAGFHPYATREEVQWMPKGRYRIMRDYLPTRGGRALDMMLRTCTVQANFDYSDEAQCGRRLRVAAAIAPIITAMFANSPYVLGELNGFVSNRSMVWTDVDPDRCGTPGFFFEEPWSYEHYVDWLLDIPMFFVKRNDRYHPHHVTFRQYMRDGFVDPQGITHRATWGDWVTHGSTVFPEVRLKPHIEFRSADAVGSRHVCALPALLKGLLYDDDAGAQAWRRLGGLDLHARHELRMEACRSGLRTERIRAIAAELLTLARDALDRFDVRDARDRSEARFLDPLETLVASGSSPGEEAAMAAAAAMNRPAQTSTGRAPAGQHALVRAFHFAGALG